MSTSRVNYNVKKIETGYEVEYYFDGDHLTHAFSDWKETLKFLSDNPPRVLEKFKTVDYVEIE